MLRLKVDTYTTPLPLDSLEAKDILWLEKALSIDYHKTTAKDILDGVLEGKYSLWRLSPPGIAVTGLAETTSWRELVCLFGAGEDYLSHVPRLIEELSDVAKSYGCAFISCASPRRGMDRVFSKLGKEQGRIFTKEL